MAHFPTNSPERIVIVGGGVSGYPSPFGSRNRGFPLRCWKPPISAAPRPEETRAGSIAAPGSLRGSATLRNIATNPFDKLLPSVLNASSRRPAA